MLEERKNIGIASMLRLEEREFFLQIDLKDLIHGAPRLLNTPVYKGYRAVWNPWEVLSEPSRIIQVKEWFKVEIEKRGWKFDAICGMSNTGTALATLLSVDLNKKLIMSDNQTFLIVPSNPKTGEKVLLVDSLIKTGVHLLNNVKIIEHSGGEVSGLAVIARDDFESDLRSIAKEWFNEQKVVYFFAYSELYEWWKEEFDKVSVLDVGDWIAKKIDNE